MTIVNLLSPHFTTGKILITGKSVFDIVVLLVLNPSKQSLRLARLILQVKPAYTMVKNKNLINLYNLVKTVNSLDLPGDIVECGVWNGGSAAIMGIAAMEDENRSRKRHLWLFDSFQGLPSPGIQDGKTAKKSHFKGWLKGNAEMVKSIFYKLGIPLENVRIIPGWFEETLKTASINNIAILHIDADWYDSVKPVLETFYNKVVPGGFIVLDDYGYWQGCNRAVEDYFSEKGIRGVTINRLGRAGAYFQKPRIRYSI